MKQYRVSDIGLQSDELALLRRLDSPAHIQDYVSSLPYNFEPNGPTTTSVRETLRSGKAHCIEAALLAAAALWVMGKKPLLMDMRAQNDSDHVVALFREKGCWGAISKSNHAVVRFRDPIYKTLRELAMSYVHEYFNEQGEKTLRAYSVAFDLSKIDPALWVTSGKESWDVGAMLDDIKHYPLMRSDQIKNLRPLDAMEQRSAKILEYKKPR